MRRDRWTRQRFFGYDGAPRRVGSRSVQESYRQGCQHGNCLPGRLLLSCSTSKSSSLDFTINANPTSIAHPSPRSSRCPHPPSWPQSSYQDPANRRPSPPRQALPHCHPKTQPSRHQRGLQWFAYWRGGPCHFTKQSGDLWWVRCDQVGKEIGEAWVVGIQENCCFALPSESTALDWVTASLINICYSSTPCGKSPFPSQRPIGYGETLLRLLRRARTLPFVKSLLAILFPLETRMLSLLFFTSASTLFELTLLRKWYVFT